MKTLQIFIILGIIGSFLVACHKDSDSSSNTCMSNRINAFKKEACDDGSVDTYLFNSQKVYVFELGTCIADGQSNVYNEQCELLGSLGGISGNSTIQGQSFNSAQFQKNIWKP